VRKIFFYYSRDLKNITCLFVFFYKMWLLSYEFTSKPLDGSDLQCSHCLSYLTDPHILPCTHRVCVDCIPQYGVCGVCGNSFNPPDVPRLKGNIEELLDEVEVFCFNREYGCSVKMKRKSIAQHFLVCEHNMNNKLLTSPVQLTQPSPSPSPLLHITPSTSGPPLTPQQCQKDEITLNPTSRSPVHSLILPPPISLTPTVHSVSDNSSSSPDDNSNPPLSPSPILSPNSVTCSSPKSTSPPKKKRKSSRKWRYAFGIALCIALMGFSCQSEREREHILVISTAPLPDLK
jgi:hypothetical protein